MRNNFCSIIQTIYTSNPYTIDRLCSTLLYAYDCGLSKRTFLVESDTNKDKSLKIKNDKRSEIVHICIDGGIIKHGLEDYVGDGIPRGRCDCMIFNDNKLLLVELKMDVEPLTKDKTLWKNFSHAMKQIKDFFLYLKASLQQEGKGINTFYSNDNIIPIICMKYGPNIHPRRNVQRNNEKEKFREETQLKIQSICEYEFL